MFDTVGSSMSESSEPESASGNLGSGSVGIEVLGPGLDFGEYLDMGLRLPGMAEVDADGRRRMAFRRKGEGVGDSCVRGGGVDVCEARAAAGGDCDREGECEGWLSSMSASEEKGIIGSEEAGARGLALGLEGGGVGRAGALGMHNSIFVSGKKTDNIK